MKIVQIIPAFVMGGAEIMCENLIYGLQKQGCEVVVISLFTMHTVITERLEKNGTTIIYLDKKYGADLSQIKKLYQVLKREKPDAIHMHLKCTFYGVPAAVLAGVKKRIYTLHHPADKDGGRLNIIVNRLNIHLFDMLPVALTEEVKKTVVSIYKVNESQVPVVLNGICLNNCHPKVSYEINTKQCINILHIGRFEKVKNHKGLIDAFKILSDQMPEFNLKLSCIGNGSLFDETKKYVDELGLREKVEFVGEKNSCFDDLYNADLFVFPSISEGMPMTLIEAMGTGLPIVASNVGGIPNMITDGKEGLLVAPETHKIAEAIKKLISNKELREQMGKNALVRAEIFSAENMAKCYMALYRGENEL